MPSSTYNLIREAILNERQVTCGYKGHYRELCPHIIGWTRGKERILAFQFGGRSSSSLPPGGEWKCLDVAGIRDAAARVGDWHTGASHQSEQRCVQDIDLDINVHVRKR